MITMNELSGFVRLGRQVYPERPNAVQIIERGPHGQRLAADPVKVRERMRPGSGFRFWTELMNVPADETWRPKQRVTGLLGLPSGWTCPIRTRDELEERISLLEVSAQRAKTPEEIERVRSEKERLLECHMQLSGSRSYKRHGEQIRNVGNLILLKKGKVSRRAVDPKSGAPRLPRASPLDYVGSSLQERSRELGEGQLCTRDQLSVPVFGPLLCKGVGQRRAWVKRPWLTAAGVVGAGLVLYGVGTGLGSSLGKK